MTSLYMYGKNPLKEGLLNKKEAIKSIFLTKNVERDKEIMSIISDNGFDYSIVTKEEIVNKLGDVVHQGILVEIQEEKLYTDFHDIINLVKNQERNNIFVILQDIEDPHNVGAIIRSSVAFSVDAIIMPEHNQAHITGTVIKSSSGTLFSVPLVKVSNINATIISLKEKGFWIYGLTGNGNCDITKTYFDSSTCIVIGSEGSGLHKKTKEHCDFELSIPISDKCESLNASIATAITLYEYRKQQK